ncbi:MAG: deoxynucleoside kinase [Lachnospiraceae bacterium]|nr:deoxynucleoside kinase [Lachnospiraceae bacterium]
MNFFVEGLQGSGKSTLVKKLSEEHPDYSAFREGDYSPVELAWCAYVPMDEYNGILDKYRAIKNEIEEKSHKENDRMIICYTQILTDIPGFHKDLERYEIYNNRMKEDEFKKVILERFDKWNTDGNIFECSIFQNIVEDMILFKNASDADIIEFYKEIREKLSGKDYQIIYLLTQDIRSSINVIRKERSDEQGNELWFPLMLAYFDESPYSKENGLSGEKALIDHFRQRQELELRICKEIFPERYTIKRPHI